MQISLHIHERHLPVNLVFFSFCPVDLVFVSFYPLCLSSPWYNPPYLQCVQARLTTMADPCHHCRYRREAASISAKLDDAVRRLARSDAALAAATTKNESLEAKVTSIEAQWAAERAARDAAVADLTRRNAECVHLHFYTCACTCSPSRLLRRDRSAFSLHSFCHEWSNDKVK